VGMSAPARKSHSLLREWRHPCLPGLSPAREGRRGQGKASSPGGESLLPHPKAVPTLRHAFARAAEAIPTLRHAFARAAEAIPTLRHAFARAAEAIPTLRHAFARAAEALSTCGRRDFCAARCVTLPVGGKTGKGDW